MRRSGEQRVNYLAGDTPTTIAQVDPVENGAGSPYSRYFLCSDNIREHACLWLWICTEDSGIWLRLWAFGLYVRESIANGGMRDSFGIVQLSGEPGESREKSGSTVRPA